MKHETKFYTTRELHEITGVALVTLQKYAFEGRIPGTVKMGGVYKFRKEAVNLALESDNIFTKEVEVNV